MEAQEKVVQYLHETHALEGALVQTLTVHIAVTPRGPYRDILERHLDETRDQARRIEERLSQLGQSRNPLQIAYGVAQNVTGQLLALSKAPIDLIRGTGGEEKLLKNAKDECATEALEIATYDALEALAEAVGDEKTAVLAREHRTQEEVMLGELREQIGELVRAVVAADVDGDPSYDVTTTGAADAVRKVTRTTKRTARKAKDEAEETAGEVEAATRAAAADVAGSAKGQAKRAQRRTKATADKARNQVEEAAEEVAERATAAAERTPGVRQVVGEAEGASADGDELPIADYASLTVEQVLRQLRGLSPTDLARVDGFEREHRNRKRVLGRIRSLRERETAGASS